MEENDHLCDRGINTKQTDMCVEQVQLVRLVNLSLLSLSLSLSSLSLSLSPCSAGEHRLLSGSVREAWPKEVAAVLSRGPVQPLCPQPAKHVSIIL